MVYNEFIKVGSDYNIIFYKLGKKYRTIYIGNNIILKTFKILTFN